MLAAGAYSFRQKSRLAIALSWIGGYVNVVAIMATAHVVSHTTGNVTLFAERLTQVRWQDALNLSLILLSFIAGAMLAAWMTHQNNRSSSSASFIRPIAAEVLLLVLFALGLAWLQFNTNAHWSVVLAVACVAAAAMGLQNATITRISGSVVRTTHLTGVFTDLGIELVQVFLWIKPRLGTQKPYRRRRLLRVILHNPASLHAALYMSIIASFLLGVIIGTWNYTHMPLLAMLVPILFLGWLIVTDWRQPIAQVRLSEQSSHSSVLIYELFKPRGDRPHRAPNFQRWVHSQLAPAQRVVVLISDPQVHLDTNAAMDLRNAAERIKKAGRQLVIANLTHEQHVRLQQIKLDLLLGKTCLHEELVGGLAKAQSLQAELSQG